MRNMPSREECLALAGRVLASPTYTPQELGFVSAVEYGSRKPLKGRAFAVHESRREIIAQALIFWSQHHA